MKPRILAAACALAAWAAVAGAAAATAAEAEAGQAGWTGLYLGVYGGAARSRDSVAVAVGGAPIGALDDVAGSGPAFGLLAGYGHRIGRAVVGVEAEAGLIRVGGEAEGAVMRIPVGVSLDYMWTGAARLRAGALATETLLLYGAAGVAGAWLEGRVEGPFGELSDAAFRWGWTVGAGVEWAATDRLRLRLEYLRADLGESDYAIEGADAATRAVTETLRAAVIHAW